MSDMAHITEEIDLRQCIDCGALVAHVKLLHMSGAVSWKCDRHHAPCLQPCMGGGVTGLEIAMLQAGNVHKRNECRKCKLPVPSFRGQRCQGRFGTNRSQQCANEARYISEHHEALCGLCSVDVAALRLVDVPNAIHLIKRVLGTLDEYLDPLLDLDYEIGALRELLGRKPGGEPV